jgi:hypothetical protein
MPDMLELALYPNPTLGKVQIVSDTELSKDLDIRVYDILGKQQNAELELSGDMITITLDISNLNEGLYLIRVIDGGIEKVLRVVKY